MVIGGGDGSLISKTIRFNLVWILVVWFSPLLGAAPVMPHPPRFVQLKQLEGNDPFSIQRPVFSDDSRYVAAWVHSSKTLTVWDVKTGKVVARVPESVHGLDSVDGLEFSLDGKKLITLRSNRPLKFIDWKQGKVVRSIDLKADPRKILAYAFSPDHSLCALGCYKNGLQVWDIKSGRKIKSYFPNQAVSGVDLLWYRNRQGKLVRKLAYGLALLPNKAEEFPEAAGIIDLDSGKITPVLKSVPPDKSPPLQAMTIIGVNWQWGGGHLLINYYQIPPRIKAGIFYFDSHGRYTGIHVLENKTVSFWPKYLAKPYYGLSITTADLSDPAKFKTAIEFLVFTRQGLKRLDIVDQDQIPVQSLRFNRDNSLAVITKKQAQTEPVTIYVYKVYPSKP